MPSGWDFESQAFRGERHATDRFECGESSLDRWLQEHAARAQARRVARTFVWCRPGTNQVLAYYSLAGHLLYRDDLPRSIGRGSPREVAAVLLTRLALDRSVQGRGAGRGLLAEALTRVVESADSVASRFVVVDAVDEAAAAFYLHHQFARVPRTLRLVLKVSAAALAVRPQDPA